MLSARRTFCPVKVDGPSETSLLASARQLAGGLPTDPCFESRVPCLGGGVDGVRRLVFADQASGGPPPGGDPAAAATGWRAPASAPVRSCRPHSFFRGRCSCTPGRSRAGLRDAAWPLAPMPINLSPKVKKNVSSATTAVATAHQNATDSRRRRLPSASSACVCRNGWRRLEVAPRSSRRQLAGFASVGHADKEHGVWAVSLR